MPESQGLAERVQRLERAEKRRTAQFLGVLALVIVLAIVPRLTRQTVTAETFILESGGQVRGSLGTSESGAPGLLLTDGNGTLRAALPVTPEGVPALVFGDQGGNVRAVMGVPTDGTPSMVMLTDSGHVRFMIP